MWNIKEEMLPFFIKYFLDELIRRQWFELVSPQFSFHLCVCVFMDMNTWLHFPLEAREGAGVTDSCMPFDIDAECGSSAKAIDVLIIELFLQAQLN